MIPKASKILTPAQYGAVAPPGDRWPLNKHDLHMYSINKIYPTVQGEGGQAGIPMTIVRLQGCPVGCVFCLLGTTLVQTSSGYKKLADVRVGDKVLGEHSDSLLYSDVVAVMSRPVGEVYKITVHQSAYGAPYIFATKEHPFRTTRGWVEAGAVLPGDVIYSLKEAHFTSWRMKTFNPMKDTATASRVAASTKARFAGMSEGSRKEYMRRAWQALPWLKDSSLNPMKRPEVAMKNAISHQRRPSGIERRVMEVIAENFLPFEYVGNNKLWIGYKCPDFVMRGQRKVVEVFDRTSFNRGPGSGWEEARKAHFEAYGYEVLMLDVPWQASKKRLAKELLDFSLNGAVVTKVERITKETAPKAYARLAGDLRSPIKVFNLACSPSHNFFANGLLTHNCDTPESWAPPGESWKHAAEVAAVVRQYPPYWVLVTGGEPCWHDLDKLTEAFKYLDLKCALETSGVYPITGTWDYVVVSPKPAGKLTLLESNIFSTADEVKWVIGNRDDVDYVEKVYGRWRQGNLLRSSARFSLQPMSTSEKATELCLEALMKHPDWRLSLQQHKYLEIA